MADFYTAGAARRVLNVPAYRFFRLVEQGDLERVPRPGSKRGVYKKEQVDELARKIRETNVISA